LAIHLNRHPEKITTKFTKLIWLHFDFFRSRLYNHTDLIFCVICFQWWMFRWRRLHERGQ
jgi:hypothetical protein